jgi:Tol biopolymer transport system component
VGEKGPEITNVRTFQPGDEVFYENHGFSPDYEKLLFTSNMYGDKSPLTNNNIYTLDLETEKLTQLTSEGYNEHATYSPDGSRILWGSNKDNKNHGMDYWIMDPDGSNKKRLTYFNAKDHPESTKKKALAIDHSWSPDGRRVMAYVQGGIGGKTGDLYLITLEPPEVSDKKTDQKTGKPTRQTHDEAPEH